MNQVDLGLRGGRREANQRPSQIGRRVRRFGNVSNAAWQILATSERHDFKRFAEVQQGRHDLMNVSAHAGGGGGKGSAVDADSEAAHRTYWIRILSRLTGRSM